MQRRANILPLQDLAKPLDLVFRLEERVIAIDGRVLTLHDTLDLACRVDRGVLDSLDVLGNEQQDMGIDVAGVDESLVFFGQRHGLFVFTSPHWLFMNW